MDDPTIIMPLSSSRLCLCFFESLLLTSKKLKTPTQNLLSVCLPATDLRLLSFNFRKLKKNNLTFFYLLYILTSFLSLSFSICCYSEINRALSYRPKWVSKPRPYRNGIYDGRSTCGRGSHDASPAAG